VDSSPPYSTYPLVVTKIFVTVPCCESKSKDSIFCFSQT
jgi:hypothetical protein